MHGGAAAAAAIARAIKASGAIVNMENRDFQQIVARANDPVVVMAVGSLLGRKSYKYLTSYKGLAFYTKSPQPLALPGAAEMIAAKRIWIPS
jgi:hypothetical protein